MTSKISNVVNQKKDEFKYFCFLSLWDEEFGPKIIDFFPREKIGDLNKLSLNLFTLYQFFWDSPDKEFQETQMVVPLQRYNKKAIVLFNTIINENIRGGKQPFIISLLLPEFYTEEQLTMFDEVILNISQFFFRNDKVNLSEYEEDILNIIDLIKTEIESPDIDNLENYSYTVAMEDFKAGIKLYQSKNFDEALMILLKVLKKFKQEDHRHLILEVLSIIASIHIQKRDFNNAKNYYYELKKISENLHVKKDIEVNTFMLGFCLYKLENFELAYETLTEINPQETQFLNKLQYYTILGRSLSFLGEYEDALISLQKALIESTDMDVTRQNQKQQAQILYDLGVINYKIGGNKYKELPEKNKDVTFRYFKEAINFLSRAAKIFIELNTKEVLVQLYFTIGDIWEIIQEFEKFIEYYEKAIDVAYKIKNHGKIIKNIRKLVERMDDLGYHKKIIEILNCFFSHEEKHFFIDQFSNAFLRYKLARALLKINKIEEALNELLKSYNIFKEFKRPVYEVRLVLEQLIQTFETLNRFDKAQLYGQKLSKTKKKFENFELVAQNDFSPLGIIKEIWIFSSSASVEIYNFAPESNIDHDLLGGFLSALQQFSLEVSQKKLNQIVIGEDRFVIYKDVGYDFYILGRAAVKENPNLVIKTLSRIHRRFWKEYSDEISNFQGNIKPFQGFTKIIESFDLSLV
ncbi:MAG: hypothetical protein GF353_30060 [Candidatus Lokiarchaeota archaeon]|nr:hypothetical protein [Candidatus Lokiarchaeota archaeon]